MSSETERLRASLPEGRVLSCTELDIRLLRTPHPYEIAHQASIAANWAEEAAANPRLFDGRVTLLSELVFSGGVLSGASHEIGFSTFLHWRKNPQGAAFHVFAHAVPVAADNALMAIRMAGHTANPGRIYFAAGSFEAGDFTGGRMDFEANALREVREETGLELLQAQREAGFNLVRLGASVLVFRRYFFRSASSAALAEAVTRHVANDQDPEIDGPVILTHSCRPEGLTRHAAITADWHFGMDDRSSSAESGA